jgi:SOS-response transcriptional repressor LexA
MVTAHASENLTGTPDLFNRHAGNIGYMNELGRNIGRRIRQLDTTQTEVAKKAGVSHVLISRLVSGNVKTTGKLPEIAAALGLEVEDLVSGKFAGGTASEPSNVAPAYFKEPHKYPVISWVQAGDWGEAVDMFQPGHADQWEASDASVGENAFWLRVVGDSMTAPSGISIPEGHMILVDPSAPADNGSLVIAKLTDSHEVTFKKLVIDAGQKYLKPLNPNYRTIEINGNCRIVGVVKEAKIKL